MNENRPPALRPIDDDPQETAEWLDAMESLIANGGPARAEYLIEQLKQRAFERGVRYAGAATTPYVNTIPVEQQPEYPGDREIERRLKHIMRWNAMAMVVRANQQSHGIGGHISTYASAATLYEVAFNHFFHGKEGREPPDQVFFQGHASPGVYARAFLLGRLTEEHLKNFRRELQPTPGLSSYPHPWLMPDFWEFPTVSMGLGPIMAIYQARFNHYLVDRGIKPDAAASRVWAFVGDGECDEPETLGAITLAAREKLDNLTFVVNCNLQRLDGPVRGNGKIIQELEGAFRGAGWNVIKVLWGADWDPLLARDSDGLLVRRMGETLDGEYQKYVVSSGEYIRKHFFGVDPRLEAIVADRSNEQLRRLQRGGHDPAKVYAAYKAAVETKGAPTVVLAHTIKGYGLGEAGEGRNITHQQKKLNEDELVEFRRRFDIPISEKAARRAEFYKPPDDSPEMRYLHERREALSGFVPGRREPTFKLKTPKWEDLAEFFAGSDGREVSTTMAFVRLLSHLMRDKAIGRHIVPIVPDEARTFGMEALFRQFGIYSHAGQLYEPVDSDNVLYYREATDGQILEEGINEAGAMSSFIAAGTSQSSHGVGMIPFFIYYSMFGFQRIGDLLWAAGDMRSRGFVLGGTAGRTTLAGEGLQHQDGNSHLNALAFPNCRAYDPCYAYEMAVIVLDGLRRMYYDEEDVFYYITLMNENYAMPILPLGSTEGICRGIYKLSPRDLGRKARWCNSSAAGRSCANHCGRRSCWSNTSASAATSTASPATNRFTTTAASATAGTACIPKSRRASPTCPKSCRASQARSSRRWTTSAPWPFDRALGNVSPLPLGEGPGVRASSYVVLGADGFGRSEARKELRRFFEVDAENIALAALVELSRKGKYPQEKLAGGDQDAGARSRQTEPRL